MTSGHDSQSQTYTADALAAGAHSIKPEYYERSGGAMIEFNWKTHRQPLAHPAADQPGAWRQRPIHRHRQQLAHHDQQPGGATTPVCPLPAGSLPLAGAAAVPAAAAAPAGVEVSLRLQTVPVSGQSVIAYRFELGKVDDRQQRPACVPPTPSRPAYPKAPI
ncbi:hypothetical protein [Candidatus Amarobacter glycogenicus]|uniref:hypothetical protein n=1 Tax=Candidatus Amarobacter glycogenicus TaxID=3140699 RepID=UPI002A0FAA75|nr:hypothetical protein [Dehalococcoidia bacterium]